MKPLLRSIGLLLAWAALLQPGSTLAQTIPTLEFAAGAGNPTGNGPSIANQVITFQNNTNNPTGTTFAAFAPTTIVTFSLSNQKYTLPTTQLSTGLGVAFGTRINTAGAASVASGLFQTVDAIGTSTAASYTSASGVTGGIDVATNMAVEVFTSAQPLPATVPANARYQYADLTITFSQPTVNPVVHVTGLGGTYGSTTAPFGFTAELDLVSSGITLSKLNGSTELSVNATQILNSAANPGAATGSGGASGSVLVSTPASGITSVTFRIYLRPGTAGGAIHPTDTSQHVGDSWLISVSELTPAPVATPKTLTFENPGGTNSTNVSAGFAGTDSQPGTLTSLTLTTFPTNATSITINGTKYTGATAFNAASVAARTLTTNGDGTLATGQTVAVDPSDGGVTSVLPFTVTDVQGSTSAAANLNIVFTATSSGYVFEDVNYGGGAGRPFSTANTSPRSGATVELYNTATGLFVASTTTDATGKYSFNTTANTGYTVRVVNSTVTSSRNSNNVAGLVPVQTYNGTTNRVGGENPALVDAPANTTGLPLSTLTLQTGATTAESLAAFNTSNNGGPDFGFNFDTVVNTNDAGQGSLRQFILNSNALGGEANLAQAGTTTAATPNAPTTALPAKVETSIFMIPDGAAHPGLLASTNGGPASQFATTTGTSKAATILLTSAALPAITGPFTAIDGGTQTSATGNSNAYSLATANAETTGPEVIIDLGYRVTPATTGFSSVQVNANDVRLLNLGIANSATSSEGITIKSNALRTIMTNNTVNNNDAGIAFDGSGTPNASVISYNVIRNARGANNDGIELNGGNNNLTISYNQILRNGGNGIDYINGSNTGNTITYNTIAGNGTAGGGQTQLSGVALRSGSSNNNTISYNTFTNNSGAGIIVVGGSTGNTFSQNSFAGNGSNTTGAGAAYTAPAGRGLAIDLTATTDKNIGANGDGVTVNAADARTGGNNLLNFPVLTTATIDKTNLVVNGYVRPNNLVELYLAAPDPTGFGEGATYLTSFTQGTAAGTAGNVTTGAASTYSGLINGLNQGTDNTNTFTVTIPLSSLTPAQITALQSGAAVLTSTATSTNSGTSEFSGNLVLAVADVTVSLTGPTTLSAGQATGTYTATFTNEGSASASDITRTLTLPVGASLSPAQRSDLITRYSATFSLDPVTNAMVINFGTVTLGNDAASPVTFAFTAPTTLSTTLALTANTTSASQGANIAPDQATLTLSTVATADVAATITAAATPTTQTFTVSFSNNGPQDAAGIVRSVQLPAGLTAASLTYTGDAVGASYNAITGLVTYPTAPTTLTAGTPLTSTISYPVASAPVTPLTATARISTSTSEAGLTANNSASATMPTQFDLTTTLSGPTAAVAGSPATLYVTTTNNGPNTAGNATQTVSIPSAATLAGSIYITNGGTYSYSGGVGTVSFPALANVPSGQTITNSISFLAPAAAFAPTAAVTTTSATETITTNNSANLNGGATGTSVVMSTIEALSNEATTIEATVGATTTPATVVDVNSTVTYTVKSFNKGYKAATIPATVVEQVQLLPGLTAATLKVGSATPSTLANGNLSYANTAGTTTYNPTSGLLTYYTVTQAAGESTTYDAITVTAPAAVGNGGQLLATASVQTTNFKDPVPADNVASVAVRVRTKPDLTASVSGPSSTVAGFPATYVARFTNSGANEAATVTETAQLPAGLSGVAITDAGGNAVAGATYDSGTGLVTFPGLTTDAVGMTQTYVIKLTAPAQNFSVTTTIASLTSDGVATNNSATQLTTVTGNADLATSITGPATAVVGNPVTYVVTTTNNGPTTATGVTPTLQLPKNLVGVDVGTGSAKYDVTTGLLTFATAATIVPGSSTNNYVTFTMPSATTTGDAAVSNGLIIATAAVTSTSADQVAANNTAALTTSISPATSAVADLATSLSRPANADGTAAPSTVPAGTLLTYIAAYRNAGSSPATSVVGTVNLPAGLSVNDLVLNGTGPGGGSGVKGTQVGNIITFGGTTNGLPAGTTYNQATGLLTFPTFATLPASTTSNSYSISFPAPARDVLAISEITSATTDNGPNLNRSNSFTAISANVDVAAALSGPTTAQPGTTATYTVTTVDNGPSANPNSTTQTVTLPAGLVPVAGSYPGGTYSNNSITWTIPANQAPGAANAVSNTFSLVMPATGNIALSTSINSTGETTNNPVTGASNGSNNTATLTTIPANQAPVAENIWNTLRGARANNALALPLSPLLATDADGSIDSYTITKAPTFGGTLYYNGTAVTDNTKVTANGLSFVPTPGFVGNATFSYIVTDDGQVPSPAALYTIPVAQDQNAVYATYNSAKGGANKYEANDVLAAVVDPNTATYNSAGAVYNATTGILLTGTANGLLLNGTNAVLAGTGPSGNSGNTLPAGVSLNAQTGQIYVSDVSATGLVNNPTARTYSVNVTTTDSNGGITTQTVTFTIGAYPLPVVLTAFTAQAVQNRDALLNWATASEVNSASFDIERSFDGTSFANIGEVAAHGTTATTHAYAFTDAGIAARAQGPVYYRLRQVDLNGTATYSPVQAVSFTKAATVALSLYPNPASATTHLDLSALPATGSYQVLVLDATGRQVLTATPGGGLPQPLDLTGLASGTYQVLVTGTLPDGTALRQTLRLLKE